MFSLSRVFILVCAGYAAICNSLPTTQPSFDISFNDSRVIRHDARASANPFDALDIRSDWFINAARSHGLEIRENVDKRAVAQIAMKVVDLIRKVVDVVKGQIDRDKKARGEFTKFLVNEGHSKHPEFNWVACHTKHRSKWKGAERVAWGHKHVEFDIKLGGTIGYEVYFAIEGEFWNDGDGGYLNWAMQGKYERKGKGGKHVVFTNPKRPKRSK